MTVSKSGKVKFLAVFIIAVMILGLLPPGGFAEGYSDIEGHYAEPFIKSWLQQGLAGGYSDGTFRPGNPVSRAEFANFIQRAYSLPGAEEVGLEFADLPAEAWFYSGVASVVGAGLMGGYPDGSFRPGSSITRQEAAVVLNKLLGLEEGEDGPSFTDKEDIAAWAVDAVQAVSRTGLMGGYPDETFRPQNAINRAETIVILERGLDYQDTKKVTETVFDKPGIFGPEEGVQTITGNVTVKADGVTLRNSVIEGNLLLHEAIGDGDVTLKNVRVSGETKVEGGGAESIIIEDCTLPSITVSKEGVRVVASGNTTVSATTLESGAILVSITTTGAGFEAVTVSQVVPPGAKISLSGQFEQVTVAAAGAEVELTEGNINTITVESEAKITGQGTITTANIKASGVEIAQNPANTNVDAGISASVGGRSVTSTSQQQSTPAYDDGGGGGGESTVAVNTITVTGTGGATTIETAGGTLQMNVSVSPVNASNKNVTWSVIAGTGNATISSAGLLTAVADGTVTVVATAQDGSGVTGQLEITISNQAASIVSGPPVSFEFEISPGSIAFELKNIADDAGNPVNTDLLALDGNSLVEFIRTTDQGIVSTFNFSFLGIDAETLSVTKDFSELYGYWMGEAFIEEFDLIESFEVTLRGTYDGQAFTDVIITDLDFTNKTAIRAFLANGLRAALDSQISDALALKASTPEGTGTGQAPTSAHNDFQTAIDSATAVQGNVNATVKELFDEIKALENAMNIFGSAIIVVTQTVVIGNISPDPVAAGTQTIVSVPIGSTNIEAGSTVTVKVYAEITLTTEIGTAAIGTIAGDGTATVNYTVPDTAGAGRYYFVANAGLTVSDAVMFVVGPDVNNSSVSGTTLPLNPLVNGTFTFQVSVRDAQNQPINGLDLYEFSYPGMITHNGSGTLNIVAVSEDGVTGNYTISATYDTAETITINAGVLFTLLGTIDAVVQ